MIAVKLSITLLIVLIVFSGSFVFSKGPEIFKINQKELLNQARNINQSFKNQRKPILINENFKNQKLKQQTTLIAQGIRSQQINGSSPSFFKPLPPLIFEEKDYGSIPYINVNSATTYQSIL